MLQSNRNYIARSFALASALAVLPWPALAVAPKAFAATLSSSADGFKSLAECESTLRRSTGVKASGGERGMRSGSLFNRTQGNISRCEMIQGEATIVVYPKGYVGYIPPE